jgi:hypothetical protein
VVIVMESSVGFRMADRGLFQSKSHIPNPQSQIETLSHSFTQEEPTVTATIMNTRRTHADLFGGALYTAGRSRNDRTLVKSAILASVFAAGVGIVQNADAEAIRFDNPAGVGHFVWGNPDGSASTPLDITLDALSQPGVVGATSLRHQFNSEWGSVTNVDNPGWAKVAKEDSFWLLGVEAGFQITGALDFSSYAYTNYPGYAGGTNLIDGVPGYLAVSFDPGDGVHYGWIGVVRDGVHLDAFAWGYETEVGVPIAAGAGIPAPGSLALLALGALARRRRRR